MLSYFFDKNRVTISPSIVIFTTFFILSLGFLYYIRSILAILFLSFIIMVALNPAVNFLEKRAKLPRSLSIGLVYVVVIAVIALMLNFLLPPLITQLYALVKTVNIPVLQNILGDVTLTMTELSAVVERVGSSFNVLMTIVMSTFNSVFTFFTLMVISFYFIQDRPELYKKASWFTRKPEHIAKVKEFLDSIEMQLGGWVRGQIILMTLMGVITYVGLALLGVPYALPLGLLAGMLEILPNLGPTIAAVPAIILAYIAAGPFLAGIVAVFYIIIQLLENNIIVPRILKDNVDVNPLVGIVTILIGVKIAGVIGALLAVPAYIVFRTLYSVWFKRYIAE